MGYTTKDIAVITEPKRVSLSALSNFVQFASKPRTQTQYAATIQVNASAYQWSPNKYYDFDGALQNSANALQKAMGPVDVRAYRGLAYHTNMYATGAAYCIGKNDAGVTVLNFQDTLPPVAADFPADISYLYLSNDFSQISAPYFTLDVTHADIINSTWAAASVLNIIEPGGAVHSFYGTEDATLVGGAVYFVAQSIADTAENLRQALLTDPWVAANFELKIPFVYDGANATNGNTLSLVSLGYGAEYNTTITAPGNAANIAYTITIVNALSQNGDSISGEASTIEISLDVYTDPPVFLGADDAPKDAAALGTFAISLSKTYSGDPLWFDVNGPFSQYGAFNTPPSARGWFNTGTLQAYRFVARITGINNYSFYVSNALYVLQGYGLASDPIDLTDYTYVDEKIKLLTNKPRTIYVKGQTEYLNFLFSDVDHGASYVPNWTLQILYRAYTTTDQFIGSGTSDPIARQSLNMVNTCVLRIDDILAAFPNAGIIRVALARGSATISEDLEYTIRPSSLHTLNQFSFLNRLGGWDAFNFDASPTEDLKATFDTYFKAVTPAHTKSDGIETAYAAQLGIPLTIVGAPVTDDVAEWLKELAASTTVLDGDGNYIIKTDFTLPTSDTQANMQIPTMKYSISETYTNE